MDHQELKEAMLDLFKGMRQELDTLIGELTEDKKNARGSMQAWSAKDMLAHLAFWGSHFNLQVEKALAGEHVPAAGDYYEILNDGVLLRNMDRPFEEVRREEEDAYKKTISLLESFSADELADTEKFEFLNKRCLLDSALGTACWHVLAHIGDYYVHQGQLKRAEALHLATTEKLKAFPGWKANATYNLACFYAQNGMKAKALENLESAFKERPELKDWAQKDTDLKPVWEEAQFRVLVK